MHQLLRGLVRASPETKKNKKVRKEKMERSIMVRMSSKRGGVGRGGGGRVLTTQEYDHISNRSNISNHELG